MNRITLDRLVSKVDPLGPDGCWLWTGALTDDGYGIFRSRILGSSQAHRSAYLLLVGPIPDGLHLDHLCRNRRCLNPDHLEPVTQAENTRRGAARRTHCSHGHERTPENTWVSRDGRNRYCRPCDRRHHVEGTARKRALREVGR